VVVNNEDDDNYSLNIVKTTDGGEPNSNASFTISVSPVNNSGNAITGNIVYTGTANNGTDYATGATTFSIADGASSTVIILDTIDDSMVEGVETVIATISNPSIGTIVTDNATANLTDEDNVGIVVAPNTLTIDENAGTGTFDVKLTAQPSSDVTIDITSADTNEATVSSSQLVFTSSN
jgi:hypothetical protein